MASNVNLTRTKRDSQTNTMRTNKSLFAYVFIHDSFTVFTLDITAPVEFTMASFCYHCFECVVPPTTAHESTPIHALRSPVTHPTLCAQSTNVFIFFTVIWTLF